MIAKLTGIVSDTGTRYAVIDVGGIGYKVSVTDDTLHRLEIGAQASFLTYLAVREDALDLYGFLSKKDREFFELLISISGIGPKSALNILSLVTADTLAESVRTGSVAHLVKVSGIGRKTAEKIVLELKDKLGGMSESNGISAGMSSDMDAILALQALGYESDDAREALKKVGKEVGDIGEKVKAALKELGK
ncbi:MAG: Holliday junction branch migration protein RuvA [Candidatus Pacebacteria bacterium]|nr:Holliday junction branch migration protein RuvA [Candidatus Paceibacterota bacterium]